MEKTGRVWRICGILLGVAIASGAATHPGSPKVKAASSSHKEVAALSVIITPTTSVPSHVQCHWTATPSGGTGPYDYAWTANNTPVGDGTSVLAYTNNGGAFHLVVTVTDATSAQAFDSKVITIGGTFCP